jgi:hypothetical protein
MSSKAEHTEHTAVLVFIQNKGQAACRPLEISQQRRSANAMAGTDVGWPDAMMSWQPLGGTSNTVHLFVVGLGAFWLGPTFDVGGDRVVAGVAGK